MSLPDIKLHYMSNFLDGAIDVMTSYRKQFIELDEQIQKLEPMFKDNHPNIEGQYPQFMRCLSICRTNLETSSMYCIKAICILFEDISK